MALAAEEEKKRLETNNNYALLSIYRGKIENVINAANVFPLVHRHVMLTAGSVEVNSDEGSSKAASLLQL